MRKFLKFCALTGLILVLAGSGIWAGAALLGGRYRYSGSRHNISFWHGLERWIDRLDNVYDWDGWDDLGDWVEDLDCHLIPVTQDFTSAKELDISKGAEYTN